MTTTQYLLDASRMPKHWYNIAADLPSPPPAVLHQRVARERARLDSIRLRPDLVLRGLEQRRDTLEGTWRLALSLDPRRPLSRGFAMVSAGGTLLTSASAARAAGAMTLSFHDGALDVEAQEGVEPHHPSRLSPPQKPARKPPRAIMPAAGQQDLFGADRKDDH